MMSVVHTSAWNGVADYGPLFIPIVMAVASAIHVSRTRDRRPGRAAEIVLLWFFGGATAQQIGFPTGNPFQFEVAMANFAFAVLGLLCLRARGRFWEATAVGFAVFYWGATLGHFIELIAHDDDAPYNAGPILITDIGLPLVILFALWRLRTQQGGRPVE